MVADLDAAALGLAIENARYRPIDNSPLATRRRTCRRCPGPAPKRHENDILPGVAVKDERSDV
jgi:hypothetical protein